jgi:hypothetical protein
VRLKDCICIENPKIDLDRFPSMLEILVKEFDQYSFKFKAPYTWYESVPNPDYNPDSMPPDDEDVFEPREAIFGFKMELKKVTHVNFNLECIFYQDNIYIDPYTYYYAKFNAYNLKSFIESWLLPDTFTFGNQLLYNKQAYKQWIDAHPDQKWAQHNYKIDKEDLAKIGIEV